MKAKTTAILLFTALIWGTSFAFQSKGMDHLQPFTFNAIRMFLAGCALLILVLILSKKNKAVDAQKTPEQRAKSKKDLRLGGLLCGLAIFLGSTFQQFGVIYTSAGKAGFITALYIVLVPILGLFLKKKVPKTIWRSVILAIIGLYLLSMSESLSLNLGDGLVMLCAIFFAIHILVIDHFSPIVDGIKMSCIQFFVCSAISAVLMLIFETPDINNILNAFFPIFYTGVISGGVGYTLQIIAQKDSDPSVASLLLSLESVFAVIGGAIILGERLSAKEIFGCALMFLAIVLIQLPGKKGAKKGEFHTEK